MKKIFIILAVCFLSLGAGMVCVAAGDDNVPSSVVPAIGSDTKQCDCANIEQTKNEPCKSYCGQYDLNDFVGIAIRASNILLGLTGSLALLALVYGGVIFIISGGNNEMVAKGKQIITGAIIGVIIVFLSFMIIQFTMNALGITSGWNASNWFKG